MKFHFRLIFDFPKLLKFIFLRNKYVNIIENYMQYRTATSGNKYMFGIFKGKNE